ncbi:hypothetical protein THAOC_05525 [Thalassiosira oceanica]|uniref:Uncharacterized protein n=1 Tax=Thalassiosira oceanica TaxID=159749 RepID=K0T719_THAOC|nr:hypothetical protein THAOC_05525 [Thalassiosira oceanica]|eukprot:EJK72899.1 hypothetical protein THAOC_05525 [Thalassiosira oceanica]
MSSSSYGENGSSGQSSGTEYEEDAPPPPRRGAKPRHSLRRLSADDTPSRVYKDPSSESSNSSGDDDFEPPAPKPTPSRKRGEIKSNIRRTGTKQKRKSTPRKKMSRNGKPKRRRSDSGEEWDESSEESSSSSEEDDDSDDSDFGAPSRTKKKPASTRKKTPAKSRGRSARASLGADRSGNGMGSDAEEETEYEVTPGGARRPKRSCKSETEEKMKMYARRDRETEKEALADVLEDDDMELLEKSDDPDAQSSSDEDGKQRPNARRNGLKCDRSAKRAKKRSSYDDDDDSYRENESSEKSESSDASDEGELEDSDDELAKKRTRRSSRNSSPLRKRPPASASRDIDEDDIGTADESSADESTAPAFLTSPAKRPSSAYGCTRARGRTPLKIIDKDASDTSDEPSTKKRMSKRRRRKKTAQDSSASDTDEVYPDEPQQCLKSPYKLKTTHINCPSLTDEITLVDLPKDGPHVCYVAPDGKTRHCFTLDTMYRIAISKAKKPDANSGWMSEESKETLHFLQPPHFRSEMDDDLLDQIASRFGRSALVIEESDIYKRMKGLGTFSVDDDMDNFDEDGDFNPRRGPVVNFNDRFQEYMRTQMGSQDIYCCPLCYTEADRRQGQDDEMGEDDSDSELDDATMNKDFFLFLDDPLTILGSLDGGQFEVAGTFCFRLLSGLKAHLKDVHNVNLREIQGNDLFNRFKIRTGDGLLQNWLKRSNGRSKTLKQGDMMNYWLDGYNQDFIQLLDRMDRVQLKVRRPGEDVSDFSTSFPRRSDKVWRVLSGPYSKDDEDVGEFIVGESDESEVDGGVQINRNFTPDLSGGAKFKSPEEQLIEHLQNSKRKQFDSSGSDSSESESKGSASSDDELEVLQPKDHGCSEVESDDEWTKSKYHRKKAEANRKEDSDDEVFMEDDVRPVKGGTPKNKRVLDDSESDDDPF